MAYDSQASADGGSNATASEPDQTSIEPNAGFGVVAKYDPPRVTLALKGELDLATTASLERAIESLAWPQLAELVIDLAELKFIDSTGLSVLLRASKRAAAASVRFSVMRVPSQPRKLFALTGTTDRLNVGS